MILTLDVYLGDGLNGMLAGVYLKEDTQKYKAGFTNRICLTNSLIAVLFKCEKSFTINFFVPLLSWPCYSFMPFSEDEEFNVSSKPSDGHMLFTKSCVGAMSILVLHVFDSKGLLEGNFYC